MGWICKVLRQRAPLVVCNLVRHYWGYISPPFDIALQGCICDTCRGVNHFATWQCRAGNWQMVFLKSIHLCRIGYHLIRSGQIFIVPILLYPSTCIGLGVCGRWDLECVQISRLQLHCKPVKCEPLNCVNMLAVAPLDFASFSLSLRPWPFHRNEITDQSHLGTSGGGGLHHWKASLFPNSLSSYSNRFIHACWFTCFISTWSKLKCVYFISFFCQEKYKYAVRLLLRG